MLKKAEKNYFNQLLGAASTQKLVKIHNTCRCLTYCNVAWCSSSSLVHVISLQVLIALQFNTISKTHLKLVLISSFQYETIILTISICTFPKCDVIYSFNLTFLSAAFRRNRAGPGRRKDQNAPLMNLGDT